MDCPSNTFSNSSLKVLGDILPNISYICEDSSAVFASFLSLSFAVAASSALVFLSNPFGVNISTTPFNGYSALPISEGLPRTTESAGFSSVQSLSFFATASNFGFSEGKTNLPLSIRSRNPSSERPSSRPLSISFSLSERLSNPSPQSSFLVLSTTVCLSLASLQALSGWARKSSFPNSFTYCVLSYKLATSATLLSFKEG